MTELPLYPPAGESRVQTLARKRDLLLQKAPGNPDAFRDAVSDLVVECVFQTLRLTGEAVERQAVLHALDEVEPPPGAAASERPLVGLIRGQIAAVELVEREARHKPTLSTELLCTVHRLSSPPSDGRFRSGPAPARFTSGQPSRPELIAEKVANLFDWLAADSGVSLHPAEKAALAFPRLLEIAPFERGNFRSAHLLMNFFAFAEGYPPFFLLLQDADTVREEIERAMVFDTAALMARFAGAIDRSLDECLTAVSRGRQPEGH